ncbi:MAG: hypothetical protein QM490_06385 [Candidatus Gracilibacteria bacterium]
MDRKKERNLKKGTKTKEQININGKKHSSSKTTYLKKVSLKRKILCSYNGTIILIPISNTNINNNDSR